MNDSEDEVLDISDIFLINEVKDRYERCSLDYCLVLSNMQLVEFVCLFE